MLRLRMLLKGVLLGMGIMLFGLFRDLFRVGAQDLYVVWRAADMLSWNAIHLLTMRAAIPILVSLALTFLALLGGMLMWRRLT